MQPLAELSLTRAWHWGIAIVGDPSAEVPHDLGDGAVAVGRDVIVLKVHHAQDIEAERFEGGWDWATATIHVRSLTQPEVTDRRLLCDEVIHAWRETVSLGDADGMLVIPTPSSRIRVVVTTQETHPHGLDEAWVDLVALNESVSDLRS